MTIEVDTIIGETKSNLKDSEDRRATRNSSGQPQKVDTKGIIPDLVEEAIPDLITVPDNMVTLDHIEMRAELGANLKIEAGAQAMAPGIEKNRQRDQRAIWKRKSKVS